jgi:DNA-3-methyladenine glycosylase
VQVARECLGKVIVHGSTAGRIVEVEAYLGLDDLAAHSSRGITERTRVIFGPPGHAYVYFIYGMYDCLNFVTEQDRTPGALLIRALEPLSGLAVMQRRRPKARRLEDFASGPGKLTLALGITRKLNGANLVESPITVRRLRDEPPIEIAEGPRIGITKCADLPLRFWIAGNRFVSR